MARKSSTRRSYRKNRLGWPIATLGTKIPLNTPARASTWLDHAPTMILGPHGTPPVQRILPSIRDIRDLSNGQIAILLTRFGVYKAWPQHIASSVGYLQRYTAYEPGTPEFKRMLDELISMESRRGLKGMARRAYREFGIVELLRAGTKEFGLMGEADDDSCAGCLEHMGDIGTYDEIIARGGKPGTHECGSLCRCQLIAMDS